MPNWIIYADIPTDSGRMICRRLAERLREADADAYARETLEVHPDWVLCVTHPNFGMHFLTSNHI